MILNAGTEYEYKITYDGGGSTHWGKYNCALAEYIAVAIMGNGDFGDDELTFSEGEWANRYGRRILSGDNQGFVNLETFDNEVSAVAAMKSAERVPEGSEDSEGNEPGAVFSLDEWHEPSESRPQTLVCGTCGDEIDSVEGYVPDEWLDAMVSAYVECALWSSTWSETEDSDPVPLDEDYSTSDVADEALDEARSDCRDFAKGEWSDLWDMDAGQAGHDFWLTRNHHGAGFWDRGLEDKGDRLTKAAHIYGGIDPYVGDDGKVYGLA
jgi:hypothetical protein